MYTQYLSWTDRNGIYSVDMVNNVPNKYMQVPIEWFANPAQQKLETLHP